MPTRQVGNWTNRMKKGKKAHGKMYTNKSKSIYIIRSRGTSLSQGQAFIINNESPRQYLWAGSTNEKACYYGVNMGAHISKHWA